MAQDRSAQIGMYAGALIFLVSAAAFILPHIDLVMNLDYPKIIRHPLIFLGVVDLLCAILLVLGWRDLPFHPFRAAFGLGFLGLLFWLQDRPLLACPPPLLRSACISAPSF